MDTETNLTTNAEANKTMEPASNVVSPLAKIEASLINKIRKHPKKHIVKRLKSSKRKTPHIKHMKDARILREIITEFENCLCVSDWPTHWSEDNIKDFLKKQTISYKSMEILPSKEIDGKISLLLVFNSEEEAKTAHKTFVDAEIQDGTLCICRGDEALCREYHSNLMTSDSSSEESLSRMIDSKGCTLKDPLDIWDEDQEGLYGLNRECLKKLGITPPLTNWVHVSNFICDRPTLKELMDLAGSVVLCHINRSKNIYAKVMYTHPIEAAQAVSMLHKQLYHGRYLSVNIDPGPHTNYNFTPNGINRLGPGFGKMGQPLRDVVKHYERKVAGKRNSLTDYIFGVADSAVSKFEVTREVTNPARDHDKIFQVVNELTALGATQYEIVGALQDLKKRKTSATNYKSEIPQLTNRTTSVASDRSEPPMPSPKTESKIEETESNCKTDKDTSDSESSNDVRNIYSPGKIYSPESPCTKDKRLQYPKKTISKIKSNASEISVLNGHVGLKRYTPKAVPAPAVPMTTSPNMGPRPCGPMLGNMPTMAPNMPRPMGPGIMHNSQPMPSGFSNSPMMGSMARTNGPTIPMQPNQFGPNPMQFSGMPGSGFQPTNAWGQMPQGPSGPAMQQEIPPSSSVVMYNIPPSITPEVLRERMATCGRVEYINAQQPGTALIKYSTRWEALACVQTFDKTTVNGNLIEAKLFT